MTIHTFKNTLLHARHPHAAIYYGAQRIYSIFKVFSLAISHNQFWNRLTTTFCVMTCKNVDIEPPFSLKDLQLAPLGTIYKSFSDWDSKQRLA